MRYPKTKPWGFWWVSGVWGSFPGQGVASLRPAGQPVSIQGGISLGALDAQISGLSLLEDTTRE